MTFLKTANLLFGAFLLLALCFTGLGVGGPGADETSGSRAIAFIDLSKVLSAHKGLLQVEMEINELLKNGEAELARTEEEMKKIEGELMVYSTESTEYLEGKNETERLELALNQKKRALIMERDSRLSEHLKKAYDEIEKAVAEYARAQGLEAVFASTQNIDQVNTNRPEEILKWVSMVEAIWHDERLDISDAIITILNGS